MTLARDRVLLWFAAGMGFQVQGRLLDHWLDLIAASVWWLSWLQ